MYQRASMCDQVMAANVEFYGKIAEIYDQYEFCASELFFQEMLENDLNRMQSRLPKGRVRCLDCGGGSGNLTLKMLARGWDVTVVDVSPDMLSVSKSKVASSGYTAEFVNDSIEHFLSVSRGTFGLITFSSVLHHLYSPLEVVQEIATRVSPGGFFYSNFDPVLPSSRVLAKCFYDLDTIVAKVTRDPGDLLPGFARRLKKLFLPQDPVHRRALLSAGDLAEYHARTGLDDLSIETALAKRGFEVDRHRYPVARTKATLWVNRCLQAFLDFKIMAQRMNGGAVAARS
jgi:SAM-dependent methyltransferase